MYLFDTVTVTIGETRNPFQPIGITFDFYQSDRFVSWNEAKGVADPQFLSDRVIEVQRKYAAQEPGIIELTSEKSKIRGYQGGMCHFVIEGTTLSLVSPLRGKEAPSSPLMLDIHAGRLLPYEAESITGWYDFILKRGFEVGISNATVNLFPQFPGEDADAYYNRDIETLFRQGYARCGVETIESLPLQQNSFLRLFDRNDTYAVIQVHKKDGTKETFQAAWTALPYISSIEVFQHAIHRVPRTSRYVDITYDQREKPINREIYVVNAATGQTVVWQFGQKQRTASLQELLQENKAELQRKADAGELKDGLVLPVSPKLRAAIQQLPSSFCRHHDLNGLETLLTA